MAGRKEKPRCVGTIPEYVGFQPEGISNSEEIRLAVDEFETIRLIDLDRLSQDETARRMEVARSTVAAIYDRARAKLADALVNGKRLLIEGGNVRFHSISDCGESNVKGEHSMRIAVTYENGQVFQHFGHTEEFKIYEIKDGKVISTEIIGSNGSGHSALAALMDERKIDVLICGGIGGGAQAALAERGIELCAGADGNADQAVEAYLRGELVNTGANCNHHGEGHSCHDHGCGEHDCGNGDCHAEQKGKNIGKTCRTHYRGTFNDGTQFDSSYDRGEPLEFVCGAGMMIKGFDAAVADMDVGQVVDIHLTPAEAYGEVDPAAIFTVETARLPGAEELTVGQRVYLQDQYGRPIPVAVAAKDEKTITFDANHEMAGKELNFRIELVEVK